MRKLRDRLNKKGFTLVELIVVIVIVLILAAVLIPNVARYIEKAKKSTFQAEAASILTEAQAIVADYYAVNDADIDQDAYDDGSEKLTTSIAVTIGNASGYKIPDESTNTHKTQEIAVYCSKGEVVGFIYADGDYYVGWPKADSNEWTPIFDAN